MTDNPQLTPQSRAEDPGAALRPTSPGPIYLVRHGQTEFNAAGRLQGRSDSPLTAAGADQARAVADFLKRAEPDMELFAIHSSPLGRAASTARILHEQLRIQSAIVFDERLAEVSCGSWEGLTQEEIAQSLKVPKVMSMRRAWARFCPDGEMPRAASDRLVAWTHDFDGKPTIAVTHGIAKGLLVAAYAALTDEQMFALPVGHTIVFKLFCGEVTVLDMAAATAQ